MDLPRPRMPARLGQGIARDPWRATMAVAALAALLICAVVSGSVWWNVRQLMTEVEAQDAETVSSLAETLSWLPDDRRPDALPDPSPRGAFAIVTADGAGIPADLGTGQQGARWQRWAARVVRQAELSSQFSIRDPAGNEWNYVRAHTDDGSIVLLGRQDAPRSAVAGAVLRALAAVVLGVLLLGAMAWVLVRWGLLRPLDSLIRSTEDLRWRGQLRDGNRERVDRLARRGDHVGRLAGSLGGVDQDVGRRFLQLSTLLETIRAVGASLDADEVLQRILGQLQRLFGVERCAVLSLDERANVFLIRASLGLSDAFVQELQVDVAEPSSPSIRALRSGEPVQVSDTYADLSFAAFRGRARRYDYRSVLAIPLMTSMAPPSALLLYRSEAYRYSHSELELATSFARFASIAMENAALYTRIDERLQEQSRRLEAIIESLDDGLVLAGLDGLVSYHNAAAAALLGAQGQRLTGAEVGELLRRLGADPSLANDSRMPNSREVTTTVDGRQRDLRLRTFTVADEHGASIGHGLLWQDITRDRFVERLKSSLLATASHELRTPLASIKGYVSTLLADDIEWDLAEQRDFLMTISSETDRLTALMRDLLDMSRIEAGALTIRTEPVRVSELVERAVAGLSSADRKRLCFEVPDDLPLVELDRSRIETAISNLVNNALKFSPPRKRVDIIAECNEGELRITVRDRGTGVPADVGDRIFESFVRGDDGLTRQVGGLGLGLAICRGFVEAHGGRVRSRPENPGTSFVLAIPTGEGGA